MIMRQRKKSTNFNLILFFIISVDFEKRRFARRIIVIYTISIASPNEKNLYFSFTAVLYAFIVLS